MTTGQLFTMQHTDGSRDTVNVGEFVLDKENKIGGFIAESNQDSFTVCFFEPNPIPEGGTLIRETLPREVVSQMLTSVANTDENIKEKWVDLLTRYQVYHDVIKKNS
jgi:hypothetical protein